MFSRNDEAEEKALFEQTEDFRESDFERNHPVVTSGKIKDSIDWRNEENVVSEVTG